MSAAGTKLGLGSKVWRRNERSRTFMTKGERGYWREVTVVGESPRLWILSDDSKLPKNGKVPYGYATSVEGFERAIWFKENIWAIARRVENLGWGVIPDPDAGFAKLKAIAELLGHEPKAPGCTKES